MTTDNGYIVPVKFEQLLKKIDLFVDNCNKIGMFRRPDPIQRPVVRFLCKYEKEPILKN